jgi:hypothetical protein|tara:strand:+ start:205 stop:477 length:273 start_codon:yes stop_codon:yes gene_type:complete
MKEKRFKKGQGLSITTIIVAAIALVVLVVLIAIFTGRFGSISKSLSEREDNSCSDLGGNCAQGCTDGFIRAFGADCTGGIGPICCIPSGE